jgi:two-component system, NtrC family, response regulator GlrR
MVSNPVAASPIGVVCACNLLELELLADLARASGRFTLEPVHWPDEARFDQSAPSAQFYLLHAGEGLASPPPALVERLGARPDHVPLIVVGNDPARRAAPSCWFPALPGADLLGTMISGMLAAGSSGEAAAPPLSLSFRRKSDMILGQSEAIRQLLHSLDQLAPAQTPVLITGESGVGKELVARALHYCGPRARAPFVAINCAAIPENLFEAELFGYQRGAFTGAVQSRAGVIEAADQGTLFLDEIGEMPLAMQAKLLRVLETSEVQRIGSSEAKKVNFRLVSATNRRLEHEVRAGRFREDLYYRVRVYPLHVPPLRERLEDVPQIVNHQLAMIAARENRPSLRMTSLALEKMLEHSWPGNVRELVNLLERAALMAESNVIDAQHIVLPQSSQAPPPAPALTHYKDAKQKFELDYYSQLMRIAGGNVSLASKLGQKTRKEIYDALKRLELDATEYRAGDDPESSRRSR